MASQLTGIGIAGAGRIACALGRLLCDRGEPVIAVASRRRAHAVEAAKFIGGIEAVSYADLPSRAARLIIAVPDDAITPVARTLAECGMRRGLALHTSGAQGAEALAPLTGQGVSCGTLHPLQSVATAQQGLSDLPGVAFAIGGDRRAIQWARRIVRLLDGKALRIGAGRRALYHAAAVMASNCVISLVDAAVTLLRQAGFGEKQALRAIGPLANVSLRNALRLGPAKALTGPIQRGDVETVRQHLRALEKVTGRVRTLYCAGGLQTVDLARRRGLSRASARKLENILREGLVEWRAL